MNVVQRAVRSAIIAGACFGVQWGGTSYLTQHVPPWLATTVALLVVVQLGFVLRSTLIRRARSKRPLVRRWAFYNAVALTAVGATAVLVERFAYLGSLQAAVLAGAICGTAAFLADEILVFR